MNHEASEPITLVLQLVLREAFRVENLARGADRRVAFQTTRHLLGGCRALGIPVRQLAIMLDRSTSIITLRSGIDGPITAQDFARLAHLSTEVIENWTDDGLLIVNTPARSVNDSYPASHLIRALLNQPPDGDRARAQTPS